MKNNLEKLKEKLRNVNDTYPEFVRGIIEYCEKYSEKNPQITEQVLKYVEENPNADSSAIIDYTDDCRGLPWGDDNGVWHRWDTIITEEEADRIVQTEYCDD